MGFSTVAAVSLAVSRPRFVKEDPLIRQDIRNWSKSKCGLLVIDPHGNLYDNLINWLAWSDLERPIIPIDLRQDVSTQVL